MASPENEKCRSEDSPERHLKDKIVGETIPSGVVFSKKLLSQSGKVWLFEETQGQRVVYVVEHGEQRWEFRLLFSAQGKFEREAAKGRRTMV